MYPTPGSLLRQRLANEHLAKPASLKPAEIVSWFGAMQAQDYPGAKWGIGLRTSSLTDRDVERACDAGQILRTHVLRPTWHFVARDDLRWLLALSGPRVQLFNARVYRVVELDRATLARSRKVIERALARGTHLTRVELQAALARAGVAASLIRLAYAVMHAELEGVICSGARRSKQSTYALVDERAPKVASIPRDEALARLARRYFQSHGPATVRDYAWWSGLTVADVRRSIEILGRDLTSTSNGLTYWFVPGRAGRSRSGTVAHLLPNYDEFLVAYKDKELSVPSRTLPRPRAGFAHHVVIDGVLAGSWSRRDTGRAADIEVETLARSTETVKGALRKAVERYRRFLG